MERCFSPHGWSVGVGSLLQQEDDDVHAAHKTRHVQGRQTGLDLQSKKIRLISVRPPDDVAPLSAI